MDNKCKEQENNRLRDYFLNRLSADEMADFQFHLLHCEECRQSLERMRHLAARWEDTREQVPQQEPVHQSYFSFRFFSRVAVVAGLVFLLAGGGFYFMSVPRVKNIPVEIDEPPVFHSADSISADSTAVNVGEKGKQDVE